jgi:predicted nucleic acid-binding protein
MICIDSNIWIYYLSEKTPEHKHVRGKMRELILKEEILSSTSIVLEVAHYFRLLPKEDLERLINSLLGLSNLKLIEIDTELMKASISLLTKYAPLGIGGRDATVLAAMDSTGTKQIITHDDVFKRLGYLDVIDPIP